MPITSVSKDPEALTMTVVAEFPVDVPRPRRIEAPDVASIAADVTVQLRGEVRRHG